MIELTQTKVLQFKNLPQDRYISSVNRSEKSMVLMDYSSFTDRHYSVVHPYRGGGVEIKCDTDINEVFIVNNSLYQNLSYLSPQEIDNFDIMVSNLQDFFFHKETAKSFLAIQGFLLDAPLRVVYTKTVNDVIMGYTKKTIKFHAAYRPRPPKVIGIHNVPMIKGRIYY